MECGNEVQRHAARTRAVRGASILAGIAAGLLCGFAQAETKTLSWTPPAEREDGTALTADELVAHRVLCKPGLDVSVPMPATSLALEPPVESCVVRAVLDDGMESADSARAIFAWEPGPEPPPAPPGVPTDVRVAVALPPSTGPPGGNMPITATGGTITEIEDGGKAYKVHTFTADGTFEITAGSGDVEYLIVAGGGGGGSRSGGGGGGAGGMLESTATDLSVDSYAVVVGGGGAGAPASALGAGQNGSDSSFNGIVATGGGGGGAASNTAGADRNGQPGGSGGGGGRSGRSGGSGTVGQGNDGGSGSSSSSNGHGGGGGGAGAVGGSGVDGVWTDNRGAGSVSNIDGSAKAYAQGGGGGLQSDNANSGGKGGGNEATPTSQSGTNGAANTGGGGGGSGGVSTFGAGGDGGSGVVILRYEVANSPTITSIPNMTIGEQATITGSGFGN